jgi:2-polyprenyl-6-methoxyphenol hydroxylase-like FAD-dependent oxidoreductase
MALETARIADEASKTEVLIVGAGPAGLFAACELLRHGVRPRIVEQRSAPHHETRGTGLQPAVLEVLDKAGVIQPFLADSARIKEVELLGPEQARIGLAQLAGLGCKYEFQCSQPQWRTESVLRDHLAGQGLQVEFGVEATSIKADGDGVTVTLDKNGRKEVVRADYLIGAGGGHSLTRHSMEQHLDGETYGGRFIVADVRLTLPVSPGRARIIVGRSGFVLLALLPESRFLIFVNREEADQNDGLPSANNLAALLNTRIGADVGLSDLRWTSYFQMHKRVVPALSDGRRFLLGDAGHLSSPMGGEGINSAFMDGANIAWKLALVLRGPPSLRCSTAMLSSARSQIVTYWRSQTTSMPWSWGLSRNVGPGKRCLCRWMIQPKRSRACASARCWTYRTRGAFLLREAPATPSQRPERAFPAGAVSMGRRTTLSFPAARHGLTISAADGATLCQSFNGQMRTCSRSKRDWPREVWSWSARTVSSASGASPRMKMR